MNDGYDIDETVRIRCVAGPLDGFEKDVAPGAEGAEAFVMYVNDATTAFAVRYDRFGKDDDGAVLYAFKGVERRDSW